MWYWKKILYTYKYKEETNFFVLSINQTNFVSARSQMQTELSVGACVCIALRRRRTPYTNIDPLSALLLLAHAHKMFFSRASKDSRRRRAVCTKKTHIFKWWTNISQFVNERCANKIHIRREAAATRTAAPPQPNGLSFKWRTNIDIYVCV